MHQTWSKPICIIELAAAKPPPTLRYASFFEDRKFMSMLGINEYSDFQNDIFVNLEDDYKSLLATDYQFYLPEMMMLKVDRTSMANSLEVRSPFVDHRLINYIMSHDTNYFDKNNQKALLNATSLKLNNE